MLHAKDRTGDVEKNEPGLEGAVPECHLPAWLPMIHQGGIFSPDEQYFKKSKLNGVESFIIKDT